MAPFLGGAKPDVLSRVIKLLDSFGWWGWNNIRSSKTFFACGSIWIWHLRCELIKTLNILMFCVLLWPYFLRLHMVLSYDLRWLGRGRECNDQEENSDWKGEGGELRAFMCKTTSLSLIHLTLHLSISPISPQLSLLPSFIHTSCLAGWRCYK